ncbi:MAG: response regulator transcription factor, partial [Polyangiaceae bacterium]|nr:response regulator transcription factor [Polyangiaceae bacterium]
PVLMLTARNAVPERVLGLRAGADDYLGKPFDFGELLARLEAIARRSEGQLESASCAGVTLDAARRSLRFEAAEVSLTPREYSLAGELFRHQGEVLSRFHLISHVWGTDFDGDPNVLDVYIGYLRAKLAEAAGERLTVRNVRGVGFRLVAQAEAS